jgi:DNA polymerase
VKDGRAVAEHLRFYAELGVDGVSRVPSWRRRQATPALIEPGGPAISVEGEIIAGGTAALAAASDALAAVANSTVPVASSTDATGRLEALRLSIGPCTRCKLHAQGRSQVVFGVGSPDARLMFVGEAPGHDEDVQGEPFVGRAGQLLTKMIEAIDLTREQVYIANVIKCRPPGNRNPEPDEISTCEPFLFEQLTIIQPKVIVALGKFAAQTLLRSTAPISKLRGQVFSYRGALLVPMFHPAFLLRSPDYKREAWEDLKKVRALLDEP